MWKWLAAGAVALLLIVAASVTPALLDARAQKRTARIRHISQVFHGLAIDRTPAPLEDEPEQLARAALLRLSDPNVSTDAADTAARTLAHLREAGTDWRPLGSALGLDAEVVGSIVDADRIDLERDQADAWTTLCRDWTPRADPSSVRNPAAADVGRRRPERRQPVRSDDWAARVERGPVRCRIAATDATTGLPIAETVVHLRGPAGPDGDWRRASGTGPEFRCEQPPEPGSSLLVWAPDHDVVEVPWNGEARLDVVLPACSATATVEVAEDWPDADLDGTCTFEVVRGTKSHHLRLASFRVRAGRPCVLAIPPDAVVHIGISGAGAGVPLPSRATVRPGETLALRRLVTRDVRLAASGGQVPADGGAFAAIDGLEHPDMTSQEIAAWRGSLGPFTPPIALASDEAGWTALDVPALAFHVWARDRDGNYAYFRASSRRDTAGSAGGLRPVVARPVAGGAPVPDGTVLIPGRLDWSTARAMSVRPCRAAGVTHFVNPRTDFDSLRLPAADTLTAIHPDHGIAWLTFDGTHVPAGAWERGEIVVRSSDGSPLDVWVDVQARWDRSDGSNWTSFGIDPGGRIDPKGAAEITLRGLPAGSYVVTFDSVSRPDGGEVQISQRGSVRVRVTAAEPRAAVTAPQGR